MIKVIVAIIVITIADVIMAVKVIIIIIGALQSDDTN